MFNDFLARVLSFRHRAAARSQGTAHSGRRPTSRRSAIDPLEDRKLLSATSPQADDALVAAPQAGSGEVVGRFLFYNNSIFDGYEPAINADDDAAIATDKRALLPGATSGFANYSSYTGGINGVMIDLANLAGTPTLEDFTFATGNDNDSGNWTSAPAPSGFVVRPGEGVNGSTRIVVTWADGSMKSTWLQVGVRPNERTNLSAADVFYFGSAVGETGNLSSQAIVNATDQILARIHYKGLSEQVPITSPYDFNRDSLVDATDEMLARNAYVGPVSMLQMITPGSSYGGQAASGDVPAPVSGPPAGESAFTDFIKSGVVTRLLFYNNSQFDQIHVGSDAWDYMAIASDKTALLPGQTATAGNYSSYAAGINGLIIDVEGAPDELALEDFSFRAGNSADPGSWSEAPAPLGFDVRPGLGVNGSTRVSFTWADGTIKNKWLQATVKATVRTGLARDDVFYFGNLVGDSGGTAFKVDAVDVQATRNAPYNAVNPAPPTAAGDYNRDRLVNTSDEWIAMQNSGRMLRALVAPRVDTTPAPQRLTPDFFQSGDGGQYISFAPNIVKTAAGTLLYFAEARYGVLDSQSFGIMMRRSTDNGVSWSEVSLIYSDRSRTVGNPSVVVDNETGQVFVLFIKDVSEVFVMSSGDEGLTWSTPRDITSSVKVTAQGNPNPTAFPDTPWGWNVVGPGHGIQLQNGAYAGRLVVPADHRYTPGTEGISWSHIIYSDDHGQTWKLGGGLDPSNPVNERSNENTIVELNDGSLYMNIRVIGSEYRFSSKSYDGGQTWTPMQRIGSMLTSSVQGSILRVNDNTLLFAAPDTTNGMRNRMTLWISQNEGLTWTKTRTVFYGYASYSDMTLIGPDTVLLTFNGGREDENALRFVKAVRVNLKWLLDTSEPDQFTWHFNDRPVGQRAPLDGPSIQDSSPWDNRAIARATSPADAPQYIAGPDGRTALRLTAGLDRVQLTPTRTVPLQFRQDDSFTVEMTVRTTDLTGVLIGTRPGVRRWELKLIEGKLAFTVDDLVQPTTLISSVAINDGAWHRIVAVRNVATREIWLYVDDVLVASAVDVTTGLIENTGSVNLGSYSDGTGQLALDIDVLRVTRAALTPEKFLAADYREPPRYVAPPLPADGPSSIPGLAFWLPAYHPDYFFADVNYSAPLALDPAPGSAARTAYDASGNRYRLSTVNTSADMLYAYDDEVGASWLHDDAGGWQIKNSGGSSNQNFDFIQNTGEFTISTFVKIDAYNGGNVTLFDNIDGSSIRSGFMLMVRDSGMVELMIVGPANSTRVIATSPPGAIATDRWYHLVVVGQGAGQPVKFYITPVSAANVATFTSPQTISGDDGNYPTATWQDVWLGSRAIRHGSPLDGQMVDQAIYNRALTEAEVQRLFDYTKRDDTQRDEDE